MNAALANRSLDAAIHLEPGLSACVAQDLFVAWKSAYDTSTPSTRSPCCYTRRPSPGTGALAQRFTTAELRGVRDYNDAFRRQKDYDAIVDVLAQYTTIKNKDLYRTIRVSGLNPDGYVNSAGLAQDLSWYRGKGYVTTTLRSTASSTTRSSRTRCAS